MPIAASRSASVSTRRRRTSSGHGGPLPAGPRTWCRRVRARTMSGWRSYVDADVVDLSGVAPMVMSSTWSGSGRSHRTVRNVSWVASRGTSKLVRPTGTPSLSNGIVSHTRIAQVSVIRVSSQSGVAASPVENSSGPLRTGRTPGSDSVQSAVSRLPVGRRWGVGGRRPAARRLARGGRGRTRPREAGGPRASGPSREGRRPTRRSDVERVGRGSAGPTTGTAVMYSRRSGKYTKPHSEAGQAAEQRAEAGQPPTSRVRPDEQGTRPRRQQVA